MSIRIKKFNPATVKEHRIIFLIGKRHTGKTVLMRDVLSQMPRPDFVMGMTPTDDTVNTFKEFMPESCIFTSFSQEKLERMLSLQRELIRRGKKRSCLLIMDDCLYQKGVLKSTAMRDLFFNGRHLNCGLICACQYLMDISPELRTNIDYLCTMRENTISNRQKLHKFFFGQYARFDDFDKVMTACTQNYSALIMDATIASTSSSDTVFWYRARTQIPPFRIGSPALWNLSQKHCRSEEEVRRAQSMQFEIEAAAAEAAANGGSNGPGGVGGSRIALVQTEDEDGNVITSAA